MESPDAWSDFESLRHNVKLNTVDRLKQILSGLNEECGTHLFKSGKKQEIIDRIVDALDTWRKGNIEDKWVKAKAVIYQVRTSGIYTPSRMSINPAVHVAGAVPQASFSPGVPLKVPSFPLIGTSTIGRYDPYAPPRKPPPPAAPIASTSSVPKPLAIRFKPSPFFHVDQAVSSIVECPESTSQTDRRQQTVVFTLNPDQIAKLRAPGSTYQLRLFCTSSAFFSLNPSVFRNTGPCPIEFPPTCEVRVNNIPLNANLKGLKKKPGTAPPPDLGKSVRVTNLQNRVEMVYVNSQQPVQSKKFYLVVMLVDVTTVEQLVEKLKKGKYRSTGDIRQKMVESMTEDDDIIAGPQKMSLKCPLSFMRINTPCRSIQCVHSQCFEANSWFSVMEQTTTWLCPVCEKVLNYEDIIIDGYFDDILKQSPESVEDVIVEADGEWHTSDNKYASAAWKASHPSAASIKPPLTPRKPLSGVKSPSHTPTKSTATNNIDGKARGDDEIFVLDSDDEDEGRVKRELSPSFGSGSSTSINRSFDSVPQSQCEGVIDLTLDSDEDEPLMSSRVGKRKATDDVLSPTEEIWKKSRTTHSSTTATSVGGSSTSVNGRKFLHFLPQNNPDGIHSSTGLPTPPPSVYAPVAYPSMPYPLPYPTGDRTTTSTTQSQAPPYASRLNIISRWP